MFKNLFYTLFATLVIALPIHASQLVNATYTGTINGVAVTARIVPAQEAEEMYGVNVHSLNISPVAITITNYKTESILVAKNAIETRGIIDPNDSHPFSYFAEKYVNNAAAWFGLTGASFAGSLIAQHLDSKLTSETFQHVPFIAAPFMVGVPLYQAMKLKNVFYNHGLTQSTVLKPLQKLSVTVFIDNKWAGYAPHMPIKVVIQSPEVKKYSRNSNAPTIFSFALPHYYISN